VSAAFLPSAALDRRDAGAGLVVPSTIAAQPDSATNTDAPKKATVRPPRSAIDKSHGSMRSSLESENAGSVGTDAPSQNLLQGKFAWRGAATARQIIVAARRGPANFR